MGMDERAIMEVLEINEFRLFGLMVVLDPIGYENELKYGYLVKGGVRKTPA